MKPLLRTRAGASRFAGRRSPRSAALVLAAIALLGHAACTSIGAPRSSSNQVAGTWRMVSAFIDESGTRTPPYGLQPRGMLVFTPDMHFVEVLTDGDAPRFASNVRGAGTDEENRRAMATTLGLFGRYTVDAHGQFAGNTVEGSTFPNWVGHVRTTRELRMRVVGDRMIETFQRPDGTRIEIEFERVR